MVITTIEVIGVDHGCDLDHFEAPFCQMNLAATLYTIIYKRKGSVNPFLPRLRFIIYLYYTKY